MILITPSVIEEISQTIGRRPAEAGGILGCAGNIIRKYYYDIDARSSPAWYEPSAHVEQVVRQWACEGIGFAGFVHSHRGRYTPTAADISYSKKVAGWFASVFPTAPLMQITTIAKTPFSGDPLSCLFPYIFDGESVLAKQFVLNKQISAL